MATNTTILGFVPGPAGRGTFDILWSCLTVLGLCAWTSLHLDLPSNREFDPFFSEIRASAQDHGRLIKIWWMIIMLFAPEAVLTIAVLDWCNAYQAVRYVNREGGISGTDMWTMNDGFFLHMGGLTHNGEPIDDDKIEQLIRGKQIPPQPSRTTEICDKSKSDALGKFLTCVQALWLAIQCLARAIQHLPISTLELGTIGYVFIAVAINGLYWYKPKDVLTPLEVLSWEARGMSPDEEGSDAVNAKPPTRWEAWLDQLTKDPHKLMMVTLGSVCVSYGGWHCLAWNFAFPSVAEQGLWRIASILTSLPGLVLMLAGFIDYFTSLTRREGDILEIATLLLYLLSRGSILVEMFIGLRRLPAGAFDTVQWMAFIPHV